MSTPGLGTPRGGQVGPGRVDPAATKAGGFTDLFSQGVGALSLFAQKRRFWQDRDGLVAVMQQRLRGPNQGAMVRVIGMNGAYLGMSVYYWGSPPDHRPNIVEHFGTHEGWIWVRHDSSTSCPMFARFRPTPLQMKVSQFARLLD
jgi:hypothetical protein